MSRIGDQLEQEWHAIRGHLPHYDHHQDQPTPEAPVTLPIITAIEDEARNLGHELTDVVHGVLARHLTVGNMLAHVGAFAAAAEASPVAQALEKFALGPAGEEFAAKIVEEAAGLLQAQGTPEVSVSQPAPVDSTPDAVPAQ